MRLTVLDIAPSDMLLSMHQQSPGETIVRYDGWMCGRYGRRGDKQRIAEWMQTHNTSVFDEFDDSYLAPSYNVAPQSMQPVVRLDAN